MGRMERGEEVGGTRRLRTAASGIIPVREVRPIASLGGDCGMHASVRVVGVVCHVLLCVNLAVRLVACRFYY